MNKTKLLAALVLILAVCNLLLCFFIFRKGPPPHPSHRMPREIIIERLGLNDQQAKEYEKLIDWHRGETKKTQDEIHHLKDQLYATLSDATVNSLKDSLINVI